jgi:hypothetical protein
METLLLFKPSEFRPSLKKLAKAPSAEKLRRLVGGDVQTVPGFDNLQYDGTLFPCVAFCNRGKRKRSPNAFATLLWKYAQRRNGCNPQPYHLAGPVVVLFQNEEPRTMPKPKRMAKRARAEETW